MKPFAFLDRDGTINADRPYLADPDGLTLLPNAVAGLRALAAAGYRLVIVTNQSGVGRGFFDQAAADAVNDRLLAMLATQDVPIEALFCCPHAPQDGCDCRKPARGLADQALALLGGVLDEAIVIGDKDSDVGFAHAIGAKSILIAPQFQNAGQTALARDLLEAAAIAVDWRQSVSLSSIPPS